MVYRLQPNPVFFLKTGFFVLGRNMLHFEIIERADKSATTRERSNDFSRFFSNWAVKLPNPGPGSATALDRSGWKGIEDRCTVGQCNCPGSFQLEGDRGPLHCPTPMCNMLLPNTQNRVFKNFQGL
jgi:hypothetical protein